MIYRIKGEKMELENIPYAPNSLTTSPIWTQENINALKNTKELLKIKEAEILSFREAYAKEREKEQPNVAVLNEINEQISLLKEECDELKKDIFELKESQYAQSVHLKPIKSVLKYQYLKPMISESELINEVGANELRALSDIHGEGIWNRAVIDDAIKDAESLISSFIKIPANSTRLLRDICTKLAIFELKRRNDFPKEELKEIRKECEDILLKMANKKIPITLEEEFLERKPQRAFIHTRKRLKLD